MAHFRTDMVNKGCVSPSLLSKGANSMEWTPSHMLKTEELQDGRNPGCLSQCVEQGLPAQECQHHLY